MVAPVPYGLQGLRRRSMPVSTAAGLRQRPGLSALQSALGGGLRGTGQLLMQLGVGRPDLAGQAFSSGLDQFDATQRQNAADAMNAEQFDWQRTQYQDEQNDRASDKAAAAQQKSDFDSAVDQLVVTGAIDAAEGDAIKAGVMKYEKPKNDPFKPNLQSYEDQGIKHSGYYDKDGKWVEMGASDTRTPKEPKTPGIITMHNSKTGEEMSMFDNDPKIANMLTSGWTEGGSPKPAEGPKPASPKDLRDEYTKANKDYEQALYGYGKVVSAARDPSPAGDIALIFGYMKTLDPGSTVREGEFATAQQAGSVPERITALYNQVLSGTRLTEAQRADFINQAKGQFGVYQNRKDVADQFYTGLSERSGISPQDVLVPYGAIPQYTPGRGGPTDERNRGSRVIDGVRIERLQ